MSEINFASMSDKPFGLLGRKLGHSFSPEIHRAIGEAAGAPYEYILFEKEPEELEDFLKGDSWSGLNVTVPYKEEVIKYLDKLSDEAADIGAVNTIVRQDGMLVGYNTDYYGFMQTLDTANVPVCESKCLILGAGGASKAVQQVLEDMGAKEIVVMSRRGEVKFSDLADHKDADVLINTTPVGMYPNTGQTLVYPGTFPKLKFAVDLIYNPLRTNLLCQAKKSSIEPISGLEMLVSQAMYSAMLFMDQVVENRDEIVSAIIDKIRTEKQNIMLIGMPGVGKTTVGNILAKILDRPVYDTDAMIVERDGRQIPDIFTQEGEYYFRDLESEACMKLSSATGAIISCGGGIIKREENYYPLAENSFIVFLNRDITNLSVEGRPLSQKNPLERLYKERLPLYRSWCDVEIDINDMSPEETVNVILDAFGFLY